MKEELSITNERIDDFVVLLGLMQQMDLPGILDRHLPRHWLRASIELGMDDQHLAGAHRLARRSPQIDGARVGASSAQHAGTGHGIGYPRDRFYG